MTNTFVPLMPVEVNAVVAVIAVPTTPLTDCAAGVICAFADAVPVPSCTAISDVSSVLTRKIRFMRGSPFVQRDASRLRTAGRLTHETVPNLHCRSATITPMTNVCNEAVT
jgi:hypothetical protein